ncbi:hypothetical protein BH24PSE1_BH24PSE1_02780 [soil metagenome]
MVEPELRPCEPVIKPMKIILYIIGFLALLGFLVLAGCFKLIF